MRYRRYLSIFVVAVLSVLTLDAPQARQNIAVQARTVVSPNPDFDSVALVDFPFTLKRHHFRFYQPDSTQSRYLARIFAQVRIFGVDGLPIDSADTYFGAQVGSPDEQLVQGINLFNRLSVLLAPGLYSARLTIIDVVSKAEAEVFFDRLEVPPSSPTQLTIGGQCLAYRIEYVGPEGEQPSRLVRNGFKILCNPLSIYGDKDTLLYYYGELYNLDYNPEVESNYTLAYELLDDSGVTLRSLGETLNSKPGQSAVITEQIDIDDWPIGTYGLRVVATDLTSNQIDSQIVKFQIIPPQVLAVSLDFADESDRYDSLYLQDRLNLVAYLLTPVEKQSLGALSDSGKVTFLERYWQETDSDPTTSIIENRNELIRRYEYANENFSTSEDRTDGWRMDRGRIYMTYGPWEDREDVQAPISGNAFEIWFYYSIREGAEFVFEDIRGFNEYTLVHSNVEGERRSEDWELRLQQEIYKIY